MEDIVEFLKTIAAVLAVLVFIVIGVLFYFSSITEKNYQNSFMYMNKGDWDNAILSLQQIPNYKDASNLYIYAYPHKLYYDKYKTIDDEVNGYKQALSFINVNKDKLSGKNNSKLSVQLSDLEKVLNFKITALNVKKQDESMKKNYEEAIQLIRAGNFQRALQALQLIEDNSMFSDDKKQLIAYINLQNAIKSSLQAQQAQKQNNGSDIGKSEGESRNAILQIISTLNPNYTGPLYQDIQKTVQGYADIGKWNSIYVGNKQGIVNIPKASITLGTKKENVLQSLGSPIKQNQLINKYGDFEELIYNNNKNIYLENNYVIAIKN